MSDKTTSVATAVRKAERAYRRFDSRTDRNELLGEVHRLTKAGVSASTIARIVGMSDRQIQRLRSTNPQQARWFRFDASQRRQDKLEAAAAAALELACRLRDEDPQLVWMALETMERHAMQELAMILLAAAPVDRTVDEIFGWVKS